MDPNPLVCELKRGHEGAHTSGGWFWIDITYAYHESNFNPMSLKERLDATRSS